MDYYSLISKSYNKLYKEEQLEKLKIIKQNIKEKYPVLDLGCANLLSKKFFPKIIGIDPAFKLLKRYSICAKAEHLPFKAKSFKTIICVTSIHHFNLKIAIEEIKRVSDNAAVIITILKKSKEFNRIKNVVKENFNVKEIDHKKDLILITKSEL